MDLKIFENTLRKFNYPVINLGEKQAYLNQSLVEELKINKESRLLFSQDATTGDFFFCVIPSIVSNIYGYKATKAGDSGGAYVSIVGIRSKTNMPFGYFKLNDPIFKDPIDWYKLEKLNLDDQ